LPEVLTVNMPDDPSFYCNMLQELKCFNTFQLTDEDFKKGLLYAQQRERTDFLNTVIDYEAYLKELETVVTIEKLNSFNLPRIVQLCQKTNQFNMTTKRYQENDIIEMENKNNYDIYSVKVQDKFGDQGITGVIIIEKTQSEWIIDSFLLSCRIIGRKIEDLLLRYIIQKAIDANIKTIKGIFIPSKKNIPAQNFYEFCGFKQENNDIIKHKQIWLYDTKTNFNAPNYIEIKENIDEKIK